MADFQGKYNGEQIEQLLDKANDIDLTKYALKTDNAPTATKLQAARTIALSGAVTGSASSDFGSNITISTTLANFDASKITSGTISIDRLPKAALERLVVAADDTARFKLTTATADTLGLVKIGYTTSGKNYAVSLDSNGKMYVNVPWTDNNTTYAQATSDKLGLVKIGYSATGKNYPVVLDGSGKMYVNVPWTDTNTTYSNMGAATSSAAGKAGLVPAPAAGAQGKYLRGDGTWQTPPNTTYAVANESTNGLMAAADKKTMNRLIGVNTVTTLANLPISKRSITATLSAATTLSVASGMQIGEELMIRCVPSAAFTQAIPNSGNYISMSGTSISTTANKPFEINIWCYASGKYSIAVKEQD